MIPHEQRLPHEQYVTEVCERLGELGVEVADGITTTPDGEVLEAAISFDHSNFAAGAIGRTAWPDGVHLGWDQREGWSLCSEGANRSLYPLDLEVYANPLAVAQRASDRLAAEGADVPVDQSWEGAGPLDDAVLAWERTVA